MGETYEVLVLKYACHHTRTRAQNFLWTDDHASPEPLDFFIWVIRNANRTILVDTGFDTVEAKRRGRPLDLEPVEALKRVGIAAEDINTIVITHLHHDHAGTLDQFPAARFHIQESEVAYATGACMCEESMRGPYSVRSHLQLRQENILGSRQFS